LEATGWVAEFMLPKAEDAPAEASEPAVDEAVAGAVAGQLLAPERAVVYGQIGVPGTSVPETAVNEQSTRALRKMKSGRTRKVSATIAYCA